MKKSVLRVKMAPYFKLLQLCSKLFNHLLPLKYNGSRGLNNFENFGPIPKLMDADLI